jgi:hypothetical protein
MKTKPCRQIIHHTLNKEPAQVKDIVNKEIASRVLALIDTKRSEVGVTLFNK